MAKTAKELIKKVLGKKCPKCNCYHGEVADVLKQALALLDTEQKEKERLEELLKQCLDVLNKSFPKMISKKFLAKEIEIALKEGGE